MSVRYMSAMFTDFRPTGHSAISNIQKSEFQMGQMVSKSSKGDLMKRFDKLTVR